MKLIKALLITWVFTAQAGLPPTTLSGQDSATSPTTFKFKTPYSQSTVAPSGGLIETGNENMLVDAGMESVGISAWTCTTGTCTKSGTNGDYSSGKQALKVALSAQALNVSQSVATSTGIQTQGIVGVLYKVPSAITDFQVCSLIVGAEQTCVPSANLIKDNLYHSIEIPVTMTAGSTVGIKFKTTATYTQNVFLDAAYIKQGLGTQNLYEGARLIGGAIVTGCANPWSTTSASYAQLGAQTGCSYAVFGEAVAPATNLAGLKFNSLPAGEYRWVYDGSYGNNNTGIVTSYFTGHDGTNKWREDIVELQNLAGGTGFRTSHMEATYNYSSAQNNVTLEFRGKNNAANNASVYGTTAFPGVFKLYYFPNNSTNVYSSTNGNYDWTSYTPIFTGFGTVASPECFHQRTGSNLNIKCKFTSGSTIASEARVSLPNSLTSAGVSLIPSTIIAGVAIRGTAVVNFGRNQSILVQPSVTYLNFSAITDGSTINPLTPQTASALYGNSEAISFFASIPISGWSNSNVIVGSFEKIEKCNDATNECVDILSATVATASGAHSNENKDFISSCTAANPSVCTFNSGYFTVAPRCVSGITSSYPTSGAIPNITSVSATGFTLATYNASSGLVTVGVPVDIICQKSGVDYKPKTAKVASSIGVPTVPGITTQAVDTFSINFGTTNATTACTVSPCSYLDQIGSAVISVTRSGAGSYSLNTNKTYLKLKCIGTYMNSSILVGSDNVSMSCNSCSTLPILTYSEGVAELQLDGTVPPGPPTATDVWGVLQCQGVY